jgi:hypothetical protein
MTSQVPAPTFDTALVDSELPSLIRKPLLGSAAVDRNNLLIASHPIFVAGSLLGAADEIGGSLCARVLDCDHLDGGHDEMIKEYGKAFADILPNHGVRNGTTFGHVLMELIADDLRIDLDALEERGFAVGSPQLFAAIRASDQKLEPRAARLALLEAFRGGFCFGLLHKDRVRDAYEEAGEDADEDDAVVYWDAGSTAFGEAQAEALSQFHEFLLGFDEERPELFGYDLVQPARVLSEIIRRPVFGDSFLIFGAVVSASYLTLVGGCLLGSAWAKRPNPYAPLVRSDQTGTTEFLISSLSTRLGTILREKDSENENTFLRILLNLNEDLLGVDVDALSRRGIPAGSPDVFDKLGDPHRKIDLSVALRILRSAFVGGVVYGVERGDGVREDYGNAARLFDEQWKAHGGNPERDVPFDEMRTELVSEFEEYLAQYRPNQAAAEG